MINKNKKIKFILVGIVNTLADFSSYSIFIFVGVPAFLSNLFSTSIALTISFFLNKKYTFNYGNKTSKKQKALFISLTLSNLWFIQPIIIYLIIYIGNGIYNNDYLISIAGKVIAVALTLSFNYIFYDRIVFKKN